MQSAFSKIKLLYRVSQPAQDCVKDWNSEPPPDYFQSALLERLAAWIPTYSRQKAKQTDGPGVCPEKSLHCRLWHVVKWSVRCRLKDSPTQTPYVQNWELFAEASWLLLCWKLSIISCLNISCLLICSSHYMKLISEIVACSCQVNVYKHDQAKPKDSCSKTC